MAAVRDFLNHCCGDDTIMQFRTKTERDAVIRVIQSYNPTCKITPSYLGQVVTAESQRFDSISFCSKIITWDGNKRRCLPDFRKSLLGRTFYTKSEKTFHENPGRLAGLMMHCYGGYSAVLDILLHYIWSCYGNIEPDFTSKFWEDF